MTRLISISTTPMIVGWRIRKKWAMGHMFIFAENQCATANAAREYNVVQSDYIAGVQHITNGKNDSKTKQIEPEIHCHTFESVYSICFLLFRPQLRSIGPMTHSIATFHSF